MTNKLSILDPTLLISLIGALGGLIWAILDILSCSLPAKYRIILLKNGKYKIQRGRLIFWDTLVDCESFDHPDKAKNVIDELIKVDRLEFEKDKIVKKIYYNGINNE